MNGSFVKVPHALLEHASTLGLTDHLLRMVIALEAHDWHNGNEVRPGHKTLAKLAGCDERRARELTSRLVEMGLVKRARPSRRQAYQYDLSPLRRHLEALSESAAIDADSVRVDQPGQAETQTGLIPPPSVRVDQRADVDAVDVDPRTSPPSPPRGNRQRDWERWVNALGPSFANYPIEAATFYARQLQSTGNLSVEYLALVLEHRFQDGSKSWITKDDERVEPTIIKALAGKRRHPISQTERIIAKQVGT